MTTAIEELVRVLQLEQLELNLFRGESRDLGFRQVFGGQVLGQALTAASATVEGRAVHSLHAYFLLPGDYRAPIIYEVDRSRDGGSFSSRRVVAIQHGQPIFHMSASFQVAQSGLDHQAAMPPAPPPEQLHDVRELVATLPGVPDDLRERFSRPLPVEFRSVNPERLMSPQPQEPTALFWFRAPGRLSDDPRLHRGVLAYASDFYLLRTAVLPHGVPFPSPHLRMATIDHAMWFHRPFRADEWMLYAMESPSASGARGLVRGSIYSRDGRLIASVMQEGMLRYRETSSQAME